MFRKFPEEFEKEMRDLLGEARAQRLLTGLCQTVPVSVRLHPTKAMQPMQGAPVPWCAAGRYLDERPSFTTDPAFHAGSYYVQEAASMFVGLFAQQFPKQPLRMLDLCAAPGGKTTLWRSLLPEGSWLVANEPIHNRTMILAENVAKWGHPDVAVTQAYPDELGKMSGYFDVIAADVPCSGEGMFRKDEGAVAEWSRENVLLCAERQRKIIADIWPALREGGCLVYSTCTFNREENEDNIDFICNELGADIVPLDIPTDWAVTGDVTGADKAVYRFLPGTTKGEGLFCCLLRKTSAAPACKPMKKNKKAKPTVISGAAELSQWLADAHDFKLLPLGEDKVMAVRQTFVEDVQRLSATVRVCQAGVTLAEQKGKKWQPRTELALSLALEPSAFPHCALDKSTALAFLRRESMVIDAPRGYVLVTYEGLPLGFVNNLGARANNLYPNEWRIRKALDCLA